MFANVNGTKLENQISCTYQRIKLCIGVMLGQNPNNTIDRLIFYASRLMSSAKKNYTATEKEALVMIYAVKKFRHYLLGNNFIFFVDH